MSKILKVCTNPYISDKLALTIRELVNPIFGNADSYIFDTRQTLKRLTVLPSILTSEEKACIESLELNYNAFILPVSDKNKDKVESTITKLERIVREVEEIPRYQITNYFGGRIVKTIAKPEKVNQDIINYLKKHEVKGVYSGDNVGEQIFKAKHLFNLFIMPCMGLNSEPILSEKAMKEVLMFQRLADYITINIEH